MNTNTFNKEAAAAYTAAVERAYAARCSLVHRLLSTPGLRVANDDQLAELFLEYDLASIGCYISFEACCNRADNLMSAAALDPIAEPAPKADLSEQLAQDHLIAALGFKPTLEYIRETYGPHWDSCSNNKDAGWDAFLAALAESVRVKRASSSEGA